MQNEEIFLEAKCVSEKENRFRVVQPKWPPVVVLQFCFPKPHSQVKCFVLRPEAKEQEQTTEESGGGGEI